MVPEEWNMDGDKDGHEEHADGFAGGLPEVVELKEGQSMSLEDLLTQLQGDGELHTFFMNFKTVLKSEKATSEVYENFLSRRSPTPEGSQLDDSTKTTSVDDGQSQGPSAVSQVTVVTETCDPSLQLRASATAPEGDGSSKVETEPGTSAHPSQKD
jgi:hypothetical protein